MTNSILRFFLLPLALLSFAACGWFETPVEPAVPDHCIEITIGNIHPSLDVRAAIRGDNAYNENLIESVDCFFYPNGATDSPAVFTAIGRGAEPAAEGDSTVYKVKVFFTDSDALRMFGSKTSGTCQLYVICNAPLSYSGDTSVPALKELVVENDFTAQTIQGSFVMSANEISTVTLTTDLSDNRSATGRIHVERAAAKIQFYLLIPDTFEDESHQFWEPVPSAGITITMANAVKKGKVDGAYTVQASDYVSYGSRALDSLALDARITGFEDYKYTHVPFYSYPAAWTDLSDYASTIIFRIPWRIVGESDYIWKKYQLSPNISELNLERNHMYRTFVSVQSLGGADLEDDAVIPEAWYQVLEWFNEGIGAGAQAQGDIPGELEVYSYLVVDEPNQVLNNQDEANFTYVTSTPLTSITFNSVVYYNNNSATPETTYNFTGDSGVKTTSTGSVTVNGETIYYDMSTPGIVSITHSLSGVYSQWRVYATLTNDDGCTQEISVVQNPSIALVRNTNAGSIFVNGYFARVASTPPGWGTTTNRYTDRINNTNYYFYHCSSLWNTTYSRINDNTQTKNGRTTGSYGTILGTTTNLHSSIDKNFYTTYISVTSFNVTNDYYVANDEQIHYRIGDPRVPSVTHYSGANSWTINANFYDYLYYNGSNTTELFAAWDDPENILITAQDSDSQSLLAPRFLVSSALNANTGLTFDKAVKRGATYQEAGYPAGRWRLPTESEIAFMVDRQKDGAIPVLYATDSYYWSGSGRLVYVPDNANEDLTFTSTIPNGETLSCRYVYDLWYWGDSPAAANVYHPNGHNTDY